MTELEEMADNWLDLDRLVKEYTARRDVVAATLRAAFPPGTTIKREAGSFRLNAPRRVFSVDRASSVLPPGWLVQVQVTRPDPALCKEKLPKEWLDECYEAKGDPFLVRVK